MKTISRRNLLTVLPVGGALTGALLAAGAEADQPHMEAALEHLKAAQSELEKAGHDKGGHRAKALDLTRKAITQVEAGIRYDRRH